MRGIVNMLSHRTRSMFVLGWSLACVAWIANPADAQRIRPTKDSTDVKRAFRTVVQPVLESIVQVRCDRRACIQGTIVGKDGWVLTKASELKGAITCSLPDGRLVDADVVDRDPRYDLALLRVDAKGLRPVTWATPDSLKLGQWVVTPLAGRQDPVGVGVLSVAPRRIPTEGGVLGIWIEDVEGVAGARVQRIAPDSGAELAGLMVGDLLTHVEGQRTPTRDLVVARISSHAAGETIEVTFVRGEETKTVHATLGAREPEEGASPWKREIMLGGDVSMHRDGYPIAFQHDTILDPSHCGGPIVGTDGKVLGINIARASRTDSFAIPAGPALNTLVDRMMRQALVRKKDEEH